MVSLSSIRSSLIVERCLVNGEWLGAPSSPVTNPASGTVLGHVPQLTAKDAHLAVDAAAEAFGGWSSLLPKQRHRYLMAWHDLIVSHKEDLARLITFEQGKPFLEALGEIDYAASFVAFYAEEAKRVCGEVLPIHRLNSQSLVLRQPVGVCAAITPWNFPAAMITRKVAPALAAGCTVVLKPAPETPFSALALGALAQEAGFPAGVINILTGDAETLVGAWMADARVRHVSFTGSTEVGKVLMAQSAQTVKRITMELGGNAPFVVFDDADLEQAVHGLMLSKFRNSGQTCVCANRIYVQCSIYERFLERFCHAVQHLVVGQGFDDGVTIGPLIHQRARAHVEQLMLDALDKGGRLLCGGPDDGLEGSFVRPTVIADAHAGMNASGCEIFGPLALVSPFETESEALTLCNKTRHGLAAYIYTRDLGRALRMSQNVAAGIVAVNAGVAGSEMAPFGGVKESGLGREGSHYGIDDYLDIKYVLLAGLEAN